MPERYVFVCINERPADHPRGSCSLKRSGDIFSELREVTGERRLENVKVTFSGCLEACPLGPVVAVYPDNVWYGGVTVEDVRLIVEQHLEGGRPVDFLQLTPEDFDAMPQPGAPT